MEQEYAGTSCKTSPARVLEELERRGRYYSYRRVYCSGAAERGGGGGAGGRDDAMLGEVYLKIREKLGYTSGNIRNQEKFILVLLLIYQKD